MPNFLSLLSNKAFKDILASQETSVRDRLVQALLGVPRHKITTSLTMCISAHARGRYATSALGELRLVCAM